MKPSNIDQYINLNMRSIMDQLPGYLVLKDLNSTYCYANKKAAQLLGFQSADELIGRTDFDLKCAAAEYAEGFVKEDQQVIEQEHLTFLSHFSYANNQWRTCLYEKNVFKDDAGAIIGSNCYVTDITDKNLIDLTRFLLKKDSATHYELCQSQFAYCLTDVYPNNQLTERETECLFFFLRGKSSKSIANILKLSPKTVEYYLEQIKIKMQCLNKAEVIEKALRKGYLNILPKRLVNTQLIEKIA